MSKKKKPSLRDIAAETGFSVITVSRVLKGDSSSHKKETAEKIMEVAERLGYRPNLTAGAVFGRQTRTVGMMIPFFDYDISYYGRIVKSAHDEFVDANYAPLLVFGTPNLDLKQQIHRLVDRRVDGILMRPMYENVDDILLSEVIDRDIPLVTVLQTNLVSNDFDYVDTNDYEAGQMAARHLVALGHTKVACMTLGPKPECSFDTNIGRRWAGFRDTMEDAGVTPILYYRERLTAEPLEMADDLLTQYPDLTGVFCPLARMSLSIYGMAQKRGLNVPEDISVIGCGELAYFKDVSPQLTTLDQHPEKIGAKAAKRLMERIEKKTPPGLHAQISPTLIERESTAPAKK